MIILVVIGLIAGIAFFFYNLFAIDSIDDLPGGNGISVQQTLEECEIIEEDIQREGCYHQILGLDKEAEKLSDCDVFVINQQWKGTCTKVVAVKENNYDYCDLIQPDATRATCVFDIACNTGDVNQCEAYDNDPDEYASTKALCWKCVAITNNNPSLCERSKDLTVRDNCYDYFI